MEDLIINDNLTVPAKDLSADFIRAGGPGGQNVNKVATKAVLIFEVNQCAVLSQPVKNRLRRLAGRRFNQAGQILLTSQQTRSQLQNLDVCLARLAALIRQALKPPVRRKKTRPPGWVDKKRLENKKKRSQTKRLRRSPAED